jgi:hypothetical protein
MSEVKTLEQWNGRTLEDYLNVGDQVDEEMINYFINIIPPATLNSRLLQVGEASNHIGGKATFTTFERVNNIWFYRGDCFWGETESRD